MSNVRKQNVHNARYKVNIKLYVKRSRWVRTATLSWRNIFESPIANDLLFLFTRNVFLFLVHYLRRRRQRGLRIHIKPNQITCVMEKEVNAKTKTEEKNCVFAYYIGINFLFSYNFASELKMFQWQYNR